MNVQHQAREALRLDQAEAMLAHVDAYERETWLTVGMALRAEFGDAAFDAWDRWSAGADNYEAAAVRSSWKGFTRGGVTIGSLIKLAMDAGYKFERSDTPPPDLAARRAERQARTDAQAAQQAGAAVAAEQVALQQWRGALREGRSEYAQRKGIDKPEACRYTPAGWLLVPALRYDLPREQSLKGLQVIRADGSKRFTFGMAKAGAACRLGLAEAGQPVLLCEGWATGMTLRMASARRLAVYVAFDAGNLPRVALMARAQHPGSTLVICADDDWQTRDRECRPLNPGRVQAAASREAVQAAGGQALMATPVFLRGKRAPEQTDFNDLHLTEGLTTVTQQLDVALEVARSMRGRRG